MVKGFWTKSTLVGLGLGQLLSLLATLTRFTSSQIVNKGIDAPFLQCFLNYVLLALVYGGIMIYRGENRKGFWYYYVILTLVDAFVKSRVIKAYQHTSLTSVMLQDCWTIPSVMFLTLLFFKTKYGLQKLVGVAICVGGLMTVIFSDIHSADRPCDLTIIVGAIIFGVRNVYEEFLVKKVDCVELMAYLGFYGASLTAPYEDERNELISNLSSPGTIFLFTGFSLAMFLYYSGVSHLLKIGGSTLLNLSLLTSNIWVVVIQNLANHEKVDWIYFVAFATIILGLIIYSWGDKMDQNNGATVAIDEEFSLVYSKNDVLPVRLQE